MTNLIVDVREQDDDVDVALENHLPKVGHGLRQRTLTSDVEPLLVSDCRRDVAGVDVAALVFLIGKIGLNSISGRGSENI